MSWPSPRSLLQGQRHTARIGIVLVRVTTLLCYVKYRKCFTPLLSMNRDSREFFPRPNSLPVNPEKDAHSLKQKSLLRQFWPVLKCILCVHFGFCYSPNYTTYNAVSVWADRDIGLIEKINLIIWNLPGLMNFPVNILNLYQNIDMWDLHDLFFLCQQHFCAASESKRQIGTTMFVVCLSVTLWFYWSRMRSA